MNTEQMKKHIADGGIDRTLVHIYGEDAVALQKARYERAIEEFAKLYGADREITLYSVAGRSELSGNHTDHNHGCVIAASIDLDVIAVASPREDSVIRVKSEGFPEDRVDFAAYTQPAEKDFGTSASLIAGMCAGFRKDGYAVGGFDAYTTSNVLKGSGLSSSAAFEDMIGNILSHLYNDGKVDNVEIAKLAQFAENRFFGKPCGLMDQVGQSVCYVRHPITSRLSSLLPGYLHFLQRHLLQRQCLQRFRPEELQPGSPSSWIPGLQCCHRLLQPVQRLLRFSEPFQVRKLQP